MGKRAPSVGQTGTQRATAGWMKLQLDTRLAWIQTSITVHPLLLPNLPATFTSWRKVMPPKRILSFQPLEINTYEQTNRNVLLFQQVFRRPWCGVDERLGRPR